jgi:hypothetical protein
MVTLLGKSACLCQLRAQKLSCTPIDCGEARYIDLARFPYMMVSRVHSDFNYCPPDYYPTTSWVGPNRLNFQNFSGPAHFGRAFCFYWQDFNRCAHERKTPDRNLRHDPPRWNPG